MWLQKAHSVRKVYTNRRLYSFEIPRTWFYVHTSLTTTYLLSVGLTNNTYYAADYSVSVVFIKFIIDSITQKKNNKTEIQIWKHSICNHMSSYRYWFKIQLRDWHLWNQLITKHCGWHIKPMDWRSRFIFTQIMLLLNIVYINLQVNKSGLHTQLAS